MRLAAIAATIAACATAASEAQPSSYLDDAARQLVLGSSQPFFDPGRSYAWLNELSVTGFFQNTSGMWINPSALTRFGRENGEHHGATSLAIERELFQLDLNYSLDADDQFFLRFWGVYEPPYPWEAGTISGATLHFDHSQSQIYNRYDAREAYWKTTRGALTLLLGRQIVTWGESIAFRVGDVVNPQDLSWNFGFADLEQSRMPLWMVHPLLNLPAIGPFGSNLLEGIWSPAWQPLYSGVSYADRRYRGLDGVAGAVNLLPPGGGRFDTYPYPFITPAEARPGIQPAFPQLGDFRAPFATFRLPAATWADSTGGVRFHTLASDAEVTLLYWHGHQFNPTPFVRGAPGSGQNLQFRYPDLNDLGVTINRPLYAEGEAPLELPLVLRSEAVWQDRMPFNSVDIHRLGGVDYSETLNTLVALDLDNLAAPRLSASGGLTVNFEWNNFTILNPNRTLVYSGYAERWRHYEENLLLSAGTSWWWGAVAPTFTSIYNPDGSTWELFPNVVLTPPWSSKYSLMVQYIGVLGNDRFSSYAGGVFKGKSILLTQFQYNFELVHGHD